MPLQKTSHIPAGCLTISKEQLDFKDELWALEELRSWNTVALSPDAEAEGGHQERFLHRDVHTALFKTSGLNPCARLCRAGWIKLEFSITTDEHATLRVYLLPDDVLRGTVDRSDTSLKKARQSVLRTLDYSKGAWDGRPPADRLESPALHESTQDGSDEQASLLQLFNRIPSPLPNPDLVFDEYSKDAMCDLLESRIPGLSTELYPYQRRSAALMLQKEVQPGTVLDPRLLHVQDQKGSGWYIDPVTATVLLEPRLYDGISGGILAEEMGAGKTIICLALILATKNLPTSPPSLYRGGELPIRNKIASLADMAASCATRNAVPWRTYFDIYQSQLGLDFAKCTEALERNPGCYYIPAPEPRRGGRHPSYHLAQPKKMHLSNATLVIVPNNLVEQWKQEIQKHTTDMKFLVVTSLELPPLESLLKFDIILFPQTRFEMVKRHFGGPNDGSLYEMHFKRCIVDEGHKLGNSRIGHKSDLLTKLDMLSFSSRWIVTGTPSHGLFGVDRKKSNGVSTDKKGAHPGADSQTTVLETSTKMEKKDLERIGAITALYLKARPWANSAEDTGDTLADWNIYLMLPKHNAKSHGRWDCLRSTLNSLIIRHQLAEVEHLLPSVEEKIVMLDGSYQDQLSLNIFSMMIIFNSVQSQRTDMDYFFHPKQRKSLMQIVHNLKQTSFFGGSFFNATEMRKAVQTAEEFLQEKKVPISLEDEAMLQEAIRLGHAAMENKLRNLSNLFHEMPVSVKDFPGGAGQSWSLGGDLDGDDAVSTSASLLLALQKTVHGAAGESEALNSLLNGHLIGQGVKERRKILDAQTSEIRPSSNNRPSQTLAGNTKLGNDRPRKSRSHGIDDLTAKGKLTADAFSGPLKSTRMTATVSAKLSYLVDGIVTHQETEKIIVFYENENIAWYLASMLDVVSGPIIRLRN